MTTSILEGSLKSRNYSEVIVERVVESLLSGELQPGMKFSAEEEFAARIGVGKNAVREAMNILRAFGVVEVRRASGVFVSEKFRGSMLNPVLCGLLIRGKQPAELAGLKVHLLGMVLSELLCDCPEALLAECRGEIAAYRARRGESAEEQQAFLEEYEEKLCRLQENAVMAQLIRGTLRFCAGLQEQAIRRKYATGSPMWFPVLYFEMTDALLKKDKKKTQHLLKSEYNALLFGATGQ